MHPISKADLLESTRVEREKLILKINPLTAEELIFPGTMGEWSVKDILQHLVDWEQRWMRWYQAGKCGEVVHTPEEGYNWRQMGLLNERYRLMNKARPLDEVMRDFYTSYRDIMEIIEAIPEDEMLTIGLYPWMGKLPLIAWISGNTCEHYRWACQMIHPVAIRRKIKDNQQK